LFTATGLTILKRSDAGPYVVSQRLTTPIKNKVTTVAEHEWLVDRVEGFSVKFARVIPLMMLREWNGDGIPDLIFAWNDQVQVHHGLGGGRFEEKAKPFDLRAYTYDELLRYSRDADIIRIEVEDLNADGLADVLVSRTEIAQLEATNWIDLFYNRGGEIVRSPHRRFKTRGLTDRPLIGDVNGDGRNDVLVWYVELGVGTIINYILWGRATINQALYLAGSNGKIPGEPSREFDTTFHFIPGKTSSASLAVRR
ncbi:MAG: VCBS repeat-containing protein, partial [Myxococcales bacterium]|nr:VCBS repeat-containing protein [Myxococcales bacterium]